MVDPQQNPVGQPAGETPEFSELTRPLCVFVDTCIFIAKNFDFDGPQFQALAKSIATGDIRLIVPKVTQEEIKSNLVQRVDEAKVAIGPCRKALRILRGLSGFKLDALFEEPKWDELNAALMGRWTKYLGQTQAILLPIDGAHAADVFEAYFSRRAPFGPGKKKSEFPDAFVLKSLESFAAKQKCKIVVVSTDQDLVSACSDSEVLIHCAELNKVIEHSARVQLLGPDEIHALLNEHETALHDSIIRDFYERSFYINVDGAPNADVEDVFDGDIGMLEVSLIDVSGDWAKFSGRAVITFRASISYEDPYMGYRDDDTKKWVSLNEVQETISTQEMVSVAFSVNVKELKAGAFKIQDISVDDDNDIWISQYDIEDRTDS